MKGTRKTKGRGKAALCLILALALSTGLLPSDVTAFAEPSEETHKVTLATCENGTLSFDAQEDSANGSAKEEAAEEDGAYALAEEDAAEGDGAYALAKEDAQDADEVYELAQADAQIDDDAYESAQADAQELAEGEAGEYGNEWEKENEQDDGEQKEADENEEENDAREIGKSEENDDSTRECAEGEEVTVNIAPDEGAILLDVTVTMDEDGTVIYQSDESDRTSFTFTMPRGDVTVNAAFSRDAKEDSEIETLGSFVRDVEGSYLAEESITLDEFYEIFNQFMKDDYVKNSSYAMVNGDFVWNNGTRWDCSSMVLYFVGYYLLPYCNDNVPVSDLPEEYSDYNSISGGYNTSTQLANWGYLIYDEDAIKSGLINDGTVNSDFGSNSGKVDVGVLQPGDLIYYGVAESDDGSYEAEDPNGLEEEEVEEGDVDHVAMYLGNGEYLNDLSNLSGSYSSDGYYQVENLGNAHSDWEPVDGRGAGSTGSGVRTNTFRLHKKGTSGTKKNAEAIAVIRLFEITENGYLTMEKVSENPSVTSGNACYNMEGAEYTVYTDANCTQIAYDENGNPAVFTIDAEGKTTTIGLEASTEGTTYYLYETKVPEGYEQDTEKHVVKLTVDDTEDEPFTVSVTECPAVDSGGISLYKIDADTGEADPQGDASLEGAQFTVEYYDYDGDDYESYVQKNSATRTWVIETKYDKATGSVYAKLDDGWKVSGSDFYRDEDTNEVVLPLGTYTVRETKAPDGYLIKGDFEYSVSGGTATGSAGDEFVTQLLYEGELLWEIGGNEYTISDTVERGDVDIAKRDYELVDYGSASDSEPQGNAALAGATFDLINNSANAVKVDKNGNGELEAEEVFAKGEIVMTITTAWDSSRGQYVATTGRDGALPYGSYLIRETKAPTGYLNEGVVERSFDIVYDGQVVDLTGDDKGISNIVERGDIDIAKWDYELAQYDASHADVSQGDATLEGATFEIVNNSANPVLVDVNGNGKYDDGELFEKGDAILTITAQWDNSRERYIATTGRDGALPYGDYLIRETKAPTGYLDEGVLERTFRIEYDGQVVDYTDNDKGMLNNIIRGGVEVQKRDVQSLRDYPQGMGSFEGITFAIINKSEWPVLVDGVLYDVGEVVMFLTTDEDGYASTAADALPYGSYTITEIEVPGSDSRETGDGYLLGNGAHDGAIAQSNLSLDFTIRENGVIVDLKGDEDSAGDASEAITDLVKRADIALVKRDGDTQSGMGSIPFEITSLTTGESHVFWTDIDGNYSSDSTWNKHSYNTNRGEDWTDGLWFYGYADGAASGVTVDDSLGALPVDNYRIDELPCDANAGYELYHGTFTIYEDVRVKTFDTIYNYPEEEPLEEEPLLSTLSLHTMAWAGDTGTQICNAEDQWVTLYDDVFYEGLTPGEEYWIYGVALDAETREPELDANGDKIYALTSFIADETGSGMELQEFYFDVENLSGRRVVFFETVYQIDEDGNAVLVVAEDPDDYANQTIYFPEIGTTLTEKESGTHSTLAGDRVTLVDTVTVKEVPEGTECIISGTLMQKSTGRPVVDENGDSVTATASFVSTGFDPQEIELTFSFDATVLAGDATVAFEDLYMVVYQNNDTEDGSDMEEPENVRIGRHADLEDEGQTVSFPGIRTTATDASSGSKNILAGSGVIYDEVTYTGLTPGATYRMVATVMDKETGKSVRVKGKIVTAEVEFVAEDADGSVIVPIEMDATGLEGTSLVVFEKAYLVSDGGLRRAKEVEIASHEDLNDEDQTVEVNAPELRTTATDASDGDKTICAEEGTICDEVNYSGFTPGETYRMAAVVMDKETGEELEVNGETVTAEIEFVVEDADGSVIVPIKIDATGLGGKSLVVFEKAYLVSDGELRLADGREIARHEDLEDEGQTVKVEEEEQSTTEAFPAGPIRTNGPKTGDSNRTIVYSVLLAAAALALLVILMMKQKGSKEADHATK